MRIAVRALALAVLCALNAGAQTGFTPAFGPPTGGVDAEGSLNGLRAFATFDDGTGPALYVGGRFWSAGQSSARHLAAWNGAAWRAIPGFDASGPNALATYDDGAGLALYAAGSFASVGGIAVNNIARYDGAHWGALGAGVAGTVNALAVYDDGAGPALFAAGSITGSVARWKNGIWTTIGGAITGTVSVLATFDDGSGPSLFAGGHFSVGGVSGTYAIARWNGTSWSSVGGGFSASNATRVSALQAYQGALIAGGLALDGAQSNTARWDGSTWSQLGGNLNGVSSLAVMDEGNGPELFCATPDDVEVFDGTTWSRIAGGSFTGDEGVYQITKLAVVNESSGPALFVAGGFTRVGSMLVSNLVRWSHGVYSAIDPGIGLAGYATAIATFDDGSTTKLVVGGNFSAAGTVAANDIAAWDGSSWSALDAGLSSVPNAMTSADLGAGPHLYAAPSALMPSYAVQSWNGSTWSALTTLGSGSVGALLALDLGAGTKLYVGGSFVQFGANRIAAWDGASWSPLGLGANNRVTALAAWDDGSGNALYAAGDFTQAGGASANHIARWNGSTWSTLGAGLSGQISALAGFDDGSSNALYAAGSFTLDGFSSERCARWNGSTWTPVSTGIPGASTVRTLFVYDDGVTKTLIAAGSFPRPGGGVQQGALRWDGASWSFFGDIVGSGYSIAKLDGPSGPALYVAGAIHAADQVGAEGIARWRSESGLGVPFCLGDGSGTACPCGNASASADQAGCLNSFGTPGMLATSGLARISADTLHLSGSGMPTTAGAYYFGGTIAKNSGNGLVFGDGLVCVGGAVVRLGTKINSGGASAYPVGGDLPISVRSGLTSPATRYYQVWYRNAASFCTSAVFNLTNGVRVEWIP